jgi:hypothetical protein
MNNTDLCKASTVQHLIGKELTAELRQELLLNHASIRIIGPYTAVTKDYLPHRLNVHFDGNNIITAVKCG